MKPAAEGSSWRSPKQDVQIRIDAAKRIATIFKKGSLNRDERREYRVLVALEHLCYHSAQTRDEYTNPRSFEILLHRVASEKAKRRRETSASSNKTTSFQDMLKYFLDMDPKHKERQRMLQTRAKARQPPSAEQHRPGDSHSASSSHDSGNNQHSDLMIHTEAYSRTPDVRTEIKLERSPSSADAPAPWYLADASSQHLHQLHHHHQPQRQQLQLHHPHTPFTRNDQQHVVGFHSPTSSAQHIASFPHPGFGAHPEHHFTAPERSVWNPHPAQMYTDTSALMLQEASLKRKPFSEESSGNALDMWSLKKVRRAFSEQTQAA